MRAVRFTDLGGNPVWLFDEWVMGVRGVLRGETREEAKAAIILSGVVQYVMEGVEECVVRLREGCDE